MPAKPIYPGMTVLEECMLLDALSATFYLGSDVKVALAKVAGSTLEIDLYALDPDLLDEYVDRVFTRVAQYSFGPDDITIVRARGIGECPYVSVDDVVDAQLFPVYIESQAIRVDDDTVKRRLPWMFRMDSTFQTISSSRDELANLNVAQLVSRVALLGLDFVGLDRVELRIDQSGQALLVRVKSRPGELSGARRVADRLQERLNSRGEVLPPWRWIVSVDDVSNDPLVWRDIGLNQRILLSQA